MLFAAVAPVVTDDFAAVEPVVTGDFAAVEPVVTGDFAAVGPVVTGDFAAVEPVVTGDFAAVGPVVTGDFAGVCKSCCTLLVVRQKSSHSATVMFLCNGAVFQFLSLIFPFVTVQMKMQNGSLGYCFFVIHPRNIHNIRSVNLFFFLCGMI